LHRIAISDATTAAGGVRLPVEDGKGATRETTLEAGRMNKLTLVTVEEEPELGQTFGELIASGWPEFMRHDVVAEKYWLHLYDLLPQFQFALLDPDSGQAVGVGNSLPLAWHGGLENLPDAGWDWALAQGVEEHNAGMSPHVLCALSITVSGEYQGKGFSAQMVTAMKQIARERGLSALIAPVRPTLKSAYPLIPMERYVRWTNDEGLYFDPWMRVHERLGGQMVKICSDSMRIVGTVAEWEGWTGMAFPESGQYVIPGALVPVNVDTDRGVCEYIEPNVWMVHHVG
jgi:GNAT superfamily N-acetyltransferase